MALFQKNPAVAAGTGAKEGGRPPGGGICKGSVEERKCGMLAIC